MKTQNCNKNNIPFGYAKELRKMIAQEYPYCAFTKVKYGEGVLRPTIDHIKSRNHGGENNERNYIVVNSKINVKKDCIGFRKFLSKHVRFINNIADYYQALLNSKNITIVAYAKKSLNTVLEELSGMHSNIASRKKFLTKKP